MTDLSPALVTAVAALDASLRKMNRLRYDMDDPPEQYSEADAVRIVNAAAESLKGMIAIPRYGFTRGEDIGARMAERDRLTKEWERRDAERQNRKAEQ